MIRLNLATDYALRTLLFLAARPGEQVTTREISEFHGISLDHVSKVVQTLAHAGYVRSERGRSGGLRLARRQEEITVGEVVEMFEGPVALLECVTSPGVCVIQRGCRLRRVLDRAGARLIRELRQVTLADLAAPDSQPLVRLEASPAARGTA